MNVGHSRLQQIALHPEVGPTSTEVVNMANELLRHRVGQGALPTTAVAQEQLELFKELRAMVAELAALQAPEVAAEADVAKAAAAEAAAFRKNKRFAAALHAMQAQIAPASKLGQRAKIAEYAFAMADELLKAETPDADD